MIEQILEGVIPAGTCPPEIDCPFEASKLGDADAARYSGEVYACEVWGPYCPESFYLDVGAHFAARAEFYQALAALSVVAGSEAPREAKIGAVAQIRQHAKRAERKMSVYAQSYGREEWHTPTAAQALAIAQGLSVFSLRGAPVDPVAQSVAVAADRAAALRYRRCIDTGDRDGAAYCLRQVFTGRGATDAYAALQASERSHISESARRAIEERRKAQ